MTKRKSMKRFIICLITIIMLVGMACRPLAATKYSLNKSKITLTASKSYTLKARRTGKSKIAWKSSNNKIATVNKKGKVTGKKAGTTVITAKIGKKQLKCVVTVKAKKKTVLQAKKKIITNAQYITNPKFRGIAKDELLVVGNTYNFADEISSKNSKPAYVMSQCSDAMIKKLMRFSSSNTKVITVSANGKATIKSPGTSVIIIKAKAKDGWKTYKETIIAVSKQSVILKPELLVTDSEFKNAVEGHYDTAASGIMFDTMKLTITNNTAYPLKLDRLEMNDTYYWSNTGKWKDVVPNSGWVMVYNSLTTLKEDRLIIQVPAYSSSTFTFTEAGEIIKQMRGLKGGTTLAGWYLLNGRSVSFIYRMKSGSMMLK